MNWRQLRKKYPVFVFDSFTYTISKHLEINIYYSISAKYKFKASFLLRNIGGRAKKLSPETLDNLVFNLGLAEIPTYWKLTCSKNIIIKPFKLSVGQVLFVQNLLKKGMGEFFYQNKIDFLQKDFVKITSAQNPPFKASREKLKDRSIIPVGGGKDSVVSLELAKKFGLDFCPLVVNPTRAASEIAGMHSNKPIYIKREIDPLLLSLNKEGFLNGHVPITALHSFVSALAAYVYNYRLVVFSCEQSSNQENLIYRGEKINHQYSKSFDFEKKFNRYAKKYLLKNFNYYSLLRPLSELQIARIFAGFEKYFFVFKSCNKGSKQNIWCNSCAKCAFAYLILSPFISPKKLILIFGKNLIASASLNSVFQNLISKNHKPFECVGTIEENQAAYHFLKHKNNKQLIKILKSWNKKNLLPQRQKTMLKKMIDSPDFVPQIVILGLGREGISSYHYFRKKLPFAQIALADRKTAINLDPVFIKQAKNDKLAHLKLGKNYLNGISGYHKIIISPGISPYQNQLVKLKSRLTGQTDIFLSANREKTIGITGTKGKSTTTKLTSALLSSSFSSKAIGNIGIPVLNELDQSDYYCFEMSSHQLQTATISPHIAVFLNIYQEHMDYYPSLIDYVSAKTNIAKFQKQNDYFIYNYDDRAVRKIAEKSKAQKISFSLRTQKTDAYLHNNFLYFRGEKIINTSLVTLPGRFNLYNVLAAICCSKILNVNKRQIKNTISSFVPLEHRMEVVGKFRDILFVNDAMATLPQATINAIDYYEKSAETIILGGHDRNYDFTDLAKRLIKSNIKNLILFPVTGGKIWELICSIRPNNHLSAYNADNMKTAVELCYRHTGKSKVCLLSTASPSFSLFKDYKDKGNQFKQQVIKQAGKNLSDKSKP